MEFNPSEIIILLFATIGPLKVTIVCASLTGSASPEFVKRLAWRAVVVASAVCLLFVVLGEAILGLFKVSIPAFQIGGGLIVLIHALEMATGTKDKSSDDEGEGVAEPSIDLAVTPLAIPMMASVSGLVAIVSLIGQRNDPKAILFLTAVIASIMALNYVCLRACKFLVALAGPVVLKVVGRIMGVLLAALAVELLVTGLIGAGVLTRNG